MSEVKNELSKGELLLEALVRLAADEIRKVLDIPEDQALLIADELATRFSTDWGGQILYLPMGRVFHTSKLYREIWDAFNGSNHAELARRFKISTQHVYRVLAKERARQVADRQARLPGVSESGDN